MGWASKGPGDVAAEIGCEGAIVLHGPPNSMVPAGLSAGAGSSIRINLAASPNETPRPHRWEVEARRSPWDFVELRKGLDQERGHFLVGGKTSRRSLREDELVRNDDLESAPAALDLLDFGVGECGQEFSGQTGRLRRVVSLHAVFDGDLHSVERLEDRPSCLGLRQVDSRPGRATEGRRDLSARPGARKHRRSVSGGTPRRPGK